MLLELCDAWLDYVPPAASLADLGLQSLPAEERPSFLACMLCADLHGSAYQDVIT